MRATYSRWVKRSLSGRFSGAASGFSLFELVVTLTVLGVMVMATVPLVQKSVQRNREVRLRESLRLIRNAIDEFKRDTIGACAPGAITSGNPTRPNVGAIAPPDPRSRVIIDDCTIFDTENLDRYPPSLDILVEGVRVKQRGLNIQGGGGIRQGSTQATEMNTSEEVIKVYLRDLPIDPMTGASDWRLRSSYQSRGDEGWDRINVFDVRSASTETALNGDRYSDW